MKFRTSLILFAASFAFAGTLSAKSLPADGATSLTSVIHRWIAEEDDNICGISNLKKVTRPALVDYERLLDATPQIKEMVRKGIDPDSAEGKTLTKAARTLITKSSQAVRKAKGFCGIWKAIAHQDERDIPDVTEAVVERF